MRLTACWLLLLPLAAGCKRAPPEADPEFSDAVRYLFRVFDEDPADVAFALRDLELQIESSMDLTSSNPNDRALTPEVLTEDDVADLDRRNSDRDLSRAIPVAVAAVSPHAVGAHAGVQLMSDQTPVEPYSPDHYVRTFLAGEDCWEGRDCERLETENDLTKDNLLMTVDYVFLKDFRWIDMNLPDPSEVPDGDEAVNDGEPRWAFLGKSWTTESFAGRNDSAWIHQTYTIEVWIPEDGGESLRMLCLWSETEFDGLSVTDDQVAATTRAGIDRNFDAVDDFLADGGR